MGTILRESQALVADYAFGYDLQSSITDAVQKAGGSIASAVRHPLGTTGYLGCGTVR
jgi:hypothetical protein